jgi:glycosyltransferase involved in cell wall biosynthesis
VIRGSDVTVVIPTIEGREELLERALYSVAAQQVQPADVVVECDRDRHGAHWARNEALKHVKTDWVCWLDDDDELLPNHIKVLVRGANKSRADLVFSYAEFVGGRDPLACVQHGRLIAEPINVPWTDECAYWIRRKGNFIPVTYLVRTNAVRAVGGFPAPYTFSAINSRDCEDYGLLLRLLDADYKFYHCTGVRTWRYHYHGENTGGRGSDRLHELEK